MRTAAEPVWYLSLRSPYSWLALRMAERRWHALWRDSEVRVFFEPGEVMSGLVAQRRLRVPYVPMSRAKHLYILRDVRRLAAELGLVPTWPVDKDPQWEVPSLPVVAALRDDAERGRALAVDLTCARWERGDDILDRAVVAASARRCGLDPALADAVDDPQVRTWAADALEDVVRHGVFGVPMVVVGSETYWGIDRLGLAAARHGGCGPGGVADQRDGQPVEGSGLPEAALGAAVVADHAGGCG